VQVLPYIEELTVYSMFDQEAGAYAPVNAELRKQLLVVLQCPSAGHDEINEEKTAAMSDYAGCHHHEEAPIDDDNSGLLFLNSAVRHVDILDGSSRTLLLGEAVANPADSLGWPSGTRATLRNTGSLKGGQGVYYSADKAKAEDAEKPLATFVGGFGGPHPGGVMAAFADGSTRFLNEDTAPEVLHQIGSRADGELPKRF